MIARRLAVVQDGQPVFLAEVDGGVVASAGSPAGLRAAVGELPVAYQRVLRGCPIQYERPTGEQVRAAIEVAGFTIRDAARALDMNPKTLQRWVNGGGMPFGVWVALNALRG